MLRKSNFANSSALPASTARFIYPAAAGFLVVLTAVTAVGALQSVWRSEGAEIVLTSGGKFAARVPGADWAPALVGPATTQAAELPTFARSSADSAVSWMSTLVADGAWSGGAARTAVALVLDKRLKLKDSVDGRRLVEAVSAETRSAPLLAKADDGLMVKIVGSARSFWSMTTSAGGSILSHILPQ